MSLVASYDNLEAKLRKFSEDTPRQSPRPLPVKPPVDQDEYMEPVVAGPSGKGKERETAPSPCDRAESEEGRVKRPLVRRVGFFSLLLLTYHLT